MVPIAEMTGVYGFFVFCNVAGRGRVEMHVVLPSKDKTIKREIVDRNRALLKDTTYAIFNDAKITFNFGTFCAKIDRRPV